MPDNSVDSIVTDPPYELGFMGKSWDSTGIAFNVDVWREALRVIKPGGHLIAFSGSRTYHRIAVAIEDAGFQIRDQIMWVYGSGFPKSLNLKDEWEGWGTALKPAHEPMVLARKPIEGTVVNNVITYGVGALNIDGSRVATNDSFGGGAKGTSGFAAGYDADGWVAGSNKGRWPANFIHDGSDEVMALFPESKGGAYPSKRGQSRNTSFASGQETEGGFRVMGDSGSAARFFYCAKASTKDRNEGLDGFEVKQQDESRKEGNPGGDNPRNRGLQQRANHHPTVKPTELMRYLVRLVTPPNGTVLDPFMGSGSTGKGALIEGFDFIGIDQSSEYVKIAKARLEYVKSDTPVFKGKGFYSTDKGDK